MIKGNIFDLEKGDAVFGFKEGGEEYFTPILEEIGLKKTNEVFRRKEDGMRLVKFKSVEGKVEPAMGLMIALCNKESLFDLLGAFYWLEGESTDDVYEYVKQQCYS